MGKSGKAARKKPKHGPKPGSNNVAKVPDDGGVQEGLGPRPTAPSAPAPAPAPAAVKKINVKRNLADAFTPSKARETAFGKKGRPVPRYMAARGQPPPTGRAREHQLRLVDMGLKWLRNSKRQSPFVWELAPLAKKGGSLALYHLLDRTPYRPTLWHVAVEQIQLAFEFARYDKLWKSRELLLDLYVLLENDNFSCDLLKAYKAGVKHVLDTTWLFVREDRAVGEPLPDGGLEEHIPLFEGLDDRQKACVWAMRAVMSGASGSSAAEKAIALDGAQGLWHYVKARNLREARARKEDCELTDLEDYSAQEQAFFQKAYDLQKTPQTVTRLAHCYMTKDTAASRERSLELAREALKLFPRSPYVQLKCAMTYDKLSKSKRDTLSAKICYLQAIHLARPWLYANLQYGKFCLSKGDRSEALFYMAEASEFFDEHSLHGPGCGLSGMFSFADLLENIFF